MQTARSKSITESVLLKRHIFMQVTKFTSEPTISVSNINLLNTSTTEVQQIVTMSFSIHYSPIRKERTGSSGDLSSATRV